MIQNCALYFPTTSLDFQKLIPGGEYEGESKTESFSFECGDGTTSLNLVSPDMNQHIAGFLGYVGQLPNSADAIHRAKQIVSQVKRVVGVVFAEPVSPQSATFTTLMECIGSADGFMFVGDSILLPSGEFLVGPLAEQVSDSGSDDIPLLTITPDDFRHEVAVGEEDADTLRMRETNYCRLAERGFRCSRCLPLYRTEVHTQELRPVEEIAKKFLAFTTLFLWVSADPESAPSDVLLAEIAQKGLRDYLSDEESAILDMDRLEANEAHCNSIGWKLENIWALAWILGFEPQPDFWCGQISDEVIDELLWEFYPPFETTVEEFLEDLTIRSATDVGMFEDLYYCAHNAVRSAQLGRDTVPSGFHPMIAGGAVHERRHALTWALSPNVAWEETDLST